MLLTACGGSFSSPHTSFASCTPLLLLPALELLPGVVVLAEFALCALLLLDVLLFSGESSIILLLSLELLLLLLLLFVLLAPGLSFRLFHGETAATFSYKVCACLARDCNQPGSETESDA